MRFIYYGSSVLLAASLAACGGSDNSDENGPGGSGQNQAPVAADMTVEFDWLKDFDGIDVLASSTDPDGDSLTLVSVGDAEYGATAIENASVSYTPEDNFIGIDSFTYVISDGSLQSEGTIEVEVVSTVALEGRVVDSPIANAQVTISIDGTNYDVEADDDGFYSLPLTIRAVKSDEIVRITARGNAANNQEHVTLSSMLVSAGRLLESATEDGKITRSEINDVNITHVTTARDVLTRRAAGDDAVTQANVAEFGNTIDPQLMIQMAAVTKLVIDDPNFELPAGYDSIEDFLNDEESYNGFVTEASSGGDTSPLNLAIEETLNDPEIMPELRVENLYGRYIQVERSPLFIKPNAHITWSINQDGIAWYNFMDEFADRATFSLNGNRVVIDDAGTALRQSSFRGFINGETFAGRPDVEAAWLAYNDNTNVYEVSREREFGLSGARVVSHSDNELVIRYDAVRRDSGYTFEFEGDVYEIWPDEVTEYQVDSRLVKVEAFLNNELTFDFSEQRFWLLPNIIPPQVDFNVGAVLYDLADDNTWSMPQADLYLLGRYTEADVTGTWELSDDSRHLTLTSASGDYSLRLTRHRDDVDYQSVLAEYIFDGNPLTTQLLHGMPVPQKLDFSAIEEVAKSNLVFNSIIIYRNAIYWDENDQLRVQDFLFDFAEDGTGEQLQGLCKGGSLQTGTICTEPMTINPETAAMTWEFEQSDIFGELFAFNRSPDSSTMDSIRYWVPLGLSELNILTVFEWNIWNDLENNEISMLVEPRFNQYQLTERPEDYVPEATEAMLTERDLIDSFNHGYKVVNPQSSQTDSSLQ